MSYLANDLERPCWYCVHWAGPCWGDPYMADCRRNDQRCCKANAARGCVHWMRETGVDDDHWSPAPMDRPDSPAGRLRIDPAAVALARRIDHAHATASTPHP